MLYGGANAPPFTLWVVIMGTVTDKEGYARYTVLVNGVSIDYRYCAHWHNNEICSYDHFEFLSHYVSETGYRSHFVASADVDNAGGCEQFSELYCVAVFKPVSLQLDLFAWFRASIIKTLRFMHSKKRGGFRSAPEKVFYCA
jgi:hypothetical protein